jgi:hypothetical protein
MFSVTIPTKRDRGLPGVVTWCIVTGNARLIRHVRGDAHLSAVTRVAALRQKRIVRRIRG